MGNIPTKTKAVDTLNNMLTNDYNETHQFWKQISIWDFLPVLDEPSGVYQSLLSISRRRKNNIIYFVRSIIEDFSKSIKMVENNKISQDLDFVSACFFLRILIAASNGNTPSWFSNSSLYISSSKPIDLLIQCLFSLLNSVNNVDQILKNPNEGNEYIKTLLFILNAEAFNINRAIQDPSIFCREFNLVPSLNYIMNSLLLIPIILEKGKDESILYLRSMLSFEIPLIYSCKNWRKSLTEINNVEILKGTIVMTKISPQNKILLCLNELIALIYTITAQKTSFIEFLSLNNLTNKYLTCLLYYFQFKLEVENVSFFHVLALLIINKFTTNVGQLMQLNEKINESFPTKYKTHPNTLSDLIIEILTNVIFYNFENKNSIFSLISIIISNISCMSSNISIFSAKRIILFLKKIHENKSILKDDFNEIFERVLISVFELLRIQSFGNFNLLSVLKQEKVFLVELSKDENNKVKEYSSFILKVVEPLDSIIDEMNKKENIIKIHNLVLPALSELNTIPKIESINVKMNKQIEALWFDWFRLLFRDINPTETTIFKLSFNTTFNKKQNVSEKIIIKKENEFHIDIKPNIKKEEEIKENKPQLVTKETIDEPFGDENEFQKFLEI